MARRRHTPDQIVRKLREADRLLGEGAEVADVARHLEGSEATYHRWRNQYGGWKAEDAKRLKPLEGEDRRREAGRRLGEGAEVADVARHLEVSEATYHRWRNQYGGLKADDAKRLKQLEGENRRLKKIVADKELEIDALREIARGNW